MHKKRALVLWAYLCLLTLAACGPKVIDDSDVVYIDYTYSLDWVVIEEWSDQSNCDRSYLNIRPKDLR